MKVIKRVSGAADQRRAPPAPPPTRLGLSILWPIITGLGKPGCYCHYKRFTFKSPSIEIRAFFVISTSTCNTARLSAQLLWVPSCGAGSQQIKACNSPNWLGRWNYSALVISSSSFLCLQCSFTVTIPNLSPPLLLGTPHSLQPANTWLPSHWQALLEKTKQDKLLLWASSFRCYFILHLFSNSLIYWFISWTIPRKL